MRRLRVLFAVLGCLAVVAAGLPAVALAWAPLQATEAGHAIASGKHCPQHCPSCEDAPCPPDAIHCAVACVGVMPALGVSSFVLPAPSGAGTIWPPRLAVLHGLALPPDPTPPRL